MKFSGAAIPWEAINFCLDHLYFIVYSFTKALKNQIL